MQRLRQKTINAFISTLNAREKRYIITKIRNDINKIDADKVSFTLHINGEVIQI